MHAVTNEMTPISAEHRDIIAENIERVGWSYDNWYADNCGIHQIRNKFIYPARFTGEFDFAGTPISNKVYSYVYYEISYGDIIRPVIIYTQTAGFGTYDGTVYDCSITHI